MSISNEAEMSYQPLGKREAGSLSQREAQTTEQLKIIDSQLGGLYEQALTLLPKIHQAGVAYLVAHAGREISRGVTKRLSSEEEIYIPPEFDEDEKYRPTIAAILQLPTTDPRVDIWLQLHRRFVSWSHYSEAGLPPPDEVRAAFEQLSSILFGRIGPYFETQAQLDEFLEIQQPSTAEVKLLQSHLLRPAQRQYFFGKLQNPLWVKLLDEAGVFSNPPDLVPTPDPNKLLIRSWPEGTYLARVAHHVPARAVSIFKRISKTLRNPAVWDVVADTASQLDPKFSYHLVGKLKEALESSSTHFFAERIVKVTAAIALAGREESFGLADHLMWVPQVTDEINNLTGVYNTEWMFPRLAYLELHDFFADVLPALEGIDAKKTLKLLLSKIDRINRFSDPNAYGLDIWRRADDIDSTRENIPAELFLAATEIAIRLAKPNRSSATHVLETLEKRSGKIFTKLRLKILANAGEHLQDKIDEIIASDDAINPPYYLREIPELVRKQFGNASPGARRIFRYGLERGPDMRQVRTEFFEGTEEFDESKLIILRNHWVRRRLTWFRGEIPEELKSLAKEVGMEEEEPTLEEQELAEVGYYSGGGLSWTAEPPIDTEDLSKRSTEEIFELLKSLPSPLTDESTATRSKLERSLLDYCINFPEKALEITKMIMKEPVAPRFINRLVVGFRQTAQANKTIEWNEVLQFAAWAIQLACEQGDNSSNERADWSDIASSAVGLARSGADNDRAPQTANESMWQIMHTATDCELIWQDSDEEPFTTFEAVLSAALNSRSGWFVEALISVSLWTRRSNLTADLHSIDSQISIHENLIPILKQVLEKQGHSGIAAQAMLGHYIPSIHYLLPEWVTQNSEELFGGGAEDPLSHPVWAAYITRAQTHPKVFEALRPWYLVAAQVGGTVPGRITEKERDWSITKSLIIKITVEMIRGNVSLGDPDQLLETVFANVPSSEKSQVYWSIFDWWRKTPPSSFVDRLAILWEWRLSEIAKHPDHPESIAEASGLSWLFRTAYVPNETLIRLGLPTIKLARGDIETYGAWETLLELSGIVPDEILEVLELILRHTLKAEYPYIPVEDVMPILRTVLLTGKPETKQHARQLINRLGEKGYVQFGELLR
jgi:hypothetical protein